MSNNAFIFFNLDKDYYTLEELSEALINREVDGILIDTYSGGTHKDLFSKPSLRVAQIVDYQTAYGVVIGGDSMRLRHCFYGYMRSHQAEIFKWVEQLVEPITVCFNVRIFLIKSNLIKYRVKITEVFLEYVITASHNAPLTSSRVKRDDPNNGLRDTK